MQINWTFPQEAWEMGFSRLNNPDDFSLMVERMTQQGPVVTASLINLGVIR